MANLAKENALKLGMACMDRFYGQKQLLRKINKPLVEKRRRARINSSLQQLKTLVVESINKTSSPKAKLEKADILEMTVRYIRNMQKQQYAAASSDPQVVNKYKAGFKACMSEVDGYFGSIDINPDVKSRVLDHLKSSADAAASPEPKKKPEATVSSEEPETSKAPLQTLQVRDTQKPKSVACKKLMMQSQDTPTTAVSSTKSVVSELAPVSSKRAAPAAACGKASNAIYTSPNVPIKHTTYQVQNVSASCSGRAQSSTSTRPAPYHIPARQQNQGLSYRVMNPRNLAQQQNIPVSMYAQNVLGNGHVQNVAQQAQNFAQHIAQQAPPAPERQMWRPW